MRHNSKPDTPVEVPPVDTEEETTEPASPSVAEEPVYLQLEGTLLTFKGETVNLAEYTEQCWWMHDGRVFYKLSVTGREKMLPVNSVAEATQLEALCNKHFRGW